MIDIDKIINANKVFKGSLKSKNALEYGIEQANLQKNVFKKLAYMVRSMTSEHAFWDGNKRTALIIIVSELEPLGFKVDIKRLENTLINLAKTGEGNISVIERRLRKCMKK